MKMANNTGGSSLHFEAIDRIGSIPIVESSLKRAEHVYGKVKGNNRIFNWYFETAEATIFAALESVQPAVKLFEAPLRQLDSVMCKSLDILEQRIPLVYLPPEMMYWNTKEYMSDRIVRPVLKRADSVKHIKTAVLESPLTTYAADRIDGALTVADMYVDKYLVPIESVGDQVDAPQEEDNNVGNTRATAAFKAILHGKRLSKKLKRRLTQRTLAEARALKKQSREAINIIIYAAELIATDPKLAMQRAKELWAYLSQDEPENQARPTTLEQLMVLLTRESARRLVHVVNFSTKLAASAPRIVVHTTTELFHHVMHISDQLMKMSKLDKVKQITKNEAEILMRRMLRFYGNLQGLTNAYLERLAIFLAGRIEAEKVDESSTRPTARSTPRRRIAHVRDNDSPLGSYNINGVY